MHDSLINNFLSFTFYAFTSEICLFYVNAIVIYIRNKIYHLPSRYA